MFVISFRKNTHFHYTPQHSLGSAEDLCFSPMHVTRRLGILTVSRAIMLGIALETVKIRNLLVTSCIGEKYIGSNLILYIWYSSAFKAVNAKYMRTSCKFFKYGSDRSQYRTACGKEKISTVLLT